MFQVKCLQFTFFVIHAALEIGLRSRPNLYVFLSCSFAIMEKQKSLRTVAKSVKVIYAL